MASNFQPTKEEIRNFSYTIDEMVTTSDYTYVEAIITYCDENELEYETAALLISDEIKYKIESEVVDKNLLVYKTNKLPLG